MEAFLQGDARGFERLYRRLAPRLRGFLAASAAIPGWPTTSTQTTFLKVHQARETYRSGAPVEPWVFAIARRTWLDHLHRRRRPEALGDDGQLPEAPSEGASPRGFESLSSDALDHWRTQPRGNCVPAARGHRAAQGRRALGGAEAAGRWPRGGLTTSR